ncbi:MAG: ABC-type dipeptide/oligopeptide/nickel transport system permease component [Verrucomicrobiales bacterium]|jgi:ABC-type dipeptide/oligopeptide/nickel transport system permease component
MLQVFGRNFAFAAGKLLLLSVIIFLILEAAPFYDSNLSFPDFFRAIFSGRLVGDQTLAELPPLNIALFYSLTTIGLALILSYGFGIPMGILLGRYRQFWAQMLGHAFVSIALAIPAFWVAYVVLYYTISDMGVFIGGESHRMGANWLAAFLGKCLLLAVPLSLSGIAIVTRQISQTILHAIPDSAIHSSHALGLTHRMIFDTILRSVIWRPILRSFPFLLSLFLSVLIVIETAFFIPGFGFAVYKSAKQTDLQSLAVLSLWVTTMLIVANLVVDIIVELIETRQPATPDTE